MRVELAAPGIANHGGKLEIHPTEEEEGWSVLRRNKVANCWHKSEGQMVLFQSLSFLLSVLSLKEQLGL